MAALQRSVSKEGGWDQGMLTDTNRVGRHSTVDLLIKVACFVKRKIIFSL
jgi:hypothetical protein